MKMQQTADTRGHHAARARWTATCRASRRWSSGSNCSNDDFIRTTEERHTVPRPAIWERMAAERRHLSRQICRLVFGARRGLLRRGRDARSIESGKRLGPQRHAGRMGRGGELFLPPLGLSGQAARALRRRARLRAAEGAAQRGRELRAAAGCRTSRSRAPPSTGASRCRATRSTSCMCGSTR